MFVRDMDSSNGVFVNDEQVTESPLESGQVLRLGGVSMLVKDAPVLASARGLPACEHHPETTATMICKQCRRAFLGRVRSYSHAVGRSDTAAVTGAQRPLRTADGNEPGYEGPAHEPRAQTAQEAPAAQAVLRLSGSRVERASVSQNA